MAIELIIPPAQVFSNTVADRGEGWLIALKLALQAFQDKKPFLVFSPGPMAENARHLEFSSLVSENPLAAARGLARATKERIVVFAGDVATAKYISSFKNVQENIKYICCNSADKQLARQTGAKYWAIASVSFPEDYMRKLLRAKSEQFAFVEVHCPSPKLWGFDSSNTIEVGRIAVNAGIWPLLECSNGTITAYKPELHEPVESYVKMQSRFSEKDLEKIRNHTIENAKFIAEIR